MRVARGAVRAKLVHLPSDDQVVVLREDHQVLPSGRAAKCGLLPQHGAVEGARRRIEGDGGERLLGRRARAIVELPLLRRVRVRDPAVIWRCKVVRCDASMAALHEDEAEDGGDVGRAQRHVVGYDDR